GIAAAITFEGKSLDIAGDKRYAGKDRNTCPTGRGRHRVAVVVADNVERVTELPRPRRSTIHFDGGSIADMPTDDVVAAAAEQPRRAFAGVDLIVVRAPFESLCTSACEQNIFAAVAE